MTRREKQFNLRSNCLIAGRFLRAALVAYDEERNAKNGNAKRKAAKTVDQSLFVFCQSIYQIEGSLSKALRTVAQLLDGKLRFKPVCYDDHIEKAVAAIFGGRNDVRFLMKEPFSMRQFKKELARLYGVTPKELTKRTQKQKDGAKNTTYEEVLKKPLKKPSDAKNTQLFDSSLRRTLARRGYTVSGKSGKTKSPRLSTERTTETPWR